MLYCCAETSQPHGDFYKRKHLIEAGLEFKGLVPYHHGRKHGGFQADTVVKRRKLRVLYLYWRAAGRETAIMPGFSI